MSAIHRRIASPGFLSRAGARNAILRSTFSALIKPSMLSALRRTSLNPLTLPRTRPNSLLLYRALSQPPMSDPASSSSADGQPAFSISPIPPNPLGDGKYIRTAAALVIGDEILNGKTHDSNSNYFARYCFQHGVELKRIEVIADDEAQIVEASRRMVNNYDFVITTGGIGSTHDDITYASLAKAFGQELVHHPETLARMAALSHQRRRFAEQTPEQKTAMERMALFPDRAEVLFVAGDIWVPVVRLEGKLCSFPGIPTLFQKLLNGLTPLLPLPPASERPNRVQIFTERPETMIAPFLTALQSRVNADRIQVGSYPVLGQGVFVSLIGRDAARLAAVARELEEGVDGHVVSEDEIASRKEGSWKKDARPVTPVVDKAKI
ncbi:unnamed protein product [Mycena citricolor]|uniref:MoaB/Mog domain-containing protein n=2 Tax=Mycena citricolor TaxID=2018698 RepID=A0AAD2GWZ8_9AGAR|nr:unnamed protein product [Mycena citricolor]